jgi:hypothetical protein
MGRTPMAGSPRLATDGSARHQHRRSVQCRPAHATDEQVADHPQLADGRGIRECLRDGWRVRNEIHHERAEHVTDAATAGRSTGSNSDAWSLLPGGNVNSVQHRTEMVPKPLVIPRRLTGDTEENRQA